MQAYFSTVLLCVLCLLSACANMNTVSTAAQTAGLSRVYTEDNERVKAAVVAAMQSLNINIKDTVDEDGALVLTFTKSISVLSWGEVGRVRVVNNGDFSSSVFLHSKKRLRTQITGVEEEEFARHLFDIISALLTKTTGDDND